ncbi:MAG: hypothetical protein IPN17_35925 [Deltaproteobacteria bacterium]|nr:hypothetical protein [Deltaproteobacteria bacterium]
MSTNGCEVNTNTSTSHCGSCGTVCPGGAACASGTCSTANCRVVGGVRWCHSATTCGQGCAAVCAGLGLPFTISDSAWFAAQDSPSECQSIADAFGMTGISMANYTYACLEDTSGVHTGRPLGALLCSTYSGCPAQHRNNADNFGVPCSSSSSRLSICPCQ